MPFQTNKRTNRKTLVALFCAAIAPLAGCSASSPELLAFVAFNALYESAIGYLPLRSVIGGIIRDTFVAIF